MLGKHLLKPQEETLLRIIYQTKDRPGPYEKRIYLSTDIPDQDDIVITIKGVVLEAPVAKIRVEPKKIKLGIIKKGSITNFNLRIGNEGRESLVITQIQNVEATENYFDSRKEGKLVIGPKESTVFKVPFLMDTVGPFVKVIFIESNARNAPHGRYAIMVIGEAEAD